MARKPRSQWSPAYRKRMESAERRGLTGPAKRGHGAAEHIARKLAAGLTASQSGQVGKFARQQARRAGGDPDAAVRALKEWTRDKGFARFQALKSHVDRRHEDKRQRETRHVVREGNRVTLHISTGPGMSALADDFEDFDLPDMPDGDDFGFLFYH